MGAKKNKWGDCQTFNRSDLAPPEMSFLVSVQSLFKIPSWRVGELRCSPAAGYPSGSKLAGHLTDPLARVQIGAAGLAFFVSCWCDLCSLGHKV